MKEITVQELKNKIDAKEDFQLIDCREEYEYEIAHLDGELIPMGEIANNIEKISKEKPVIIHCRTGGRSGAICNMLEMQHGFDNVYNLKGGILAWADEIDPSMTKY